MTNLGSGVIMLPNSRTKLHKVTDLGSRRAQATHILQTNLTTELPADFFEEDFKPKMKRKKRSWQK